MIDGAFLSASADVDRLVAACRTVHEVAAQPALAAWITSRVVDVDLVDLTAARRMVRDRAISQWHMAGTCRMGLDVDTVVDDQLRVHGVHGLRVVDASVMPRVVWGPCQAAVFAIAERAADLIAAEHRLAAMPPPDTG